MKLDKYALLSLVLGLFMTGCREVSFKEPQPPGVKALEQIPAELQGKYLSYDAKTGEIGDSLIIESWGYHFKDKDEKDWLGRGVLSDSLVVKFYENIYFVNFRTGDQWVLRLLRRKPSGAIEFLSIDIQDEAKRKEMLRKMERRFTVREITRKDDTFYQINPTRDQLMQLIKEGFFTGTTLDKVKN